MIDAILHEDDDAESPRRISVSDPPPPVLTIPVLATPQWFEPSGYPPTFDQKTLRFVGYTSDGAAIYA